MATAIKRSYGQQTTDSDVTASAQQSSKPLKFGMISGGSSFFIPIGEGWMTACEKLGVECYYEAHNATLWPEQEGECAFRSYLADQWIAEKVDGIAFKGCGNWSIMTDVVNKIIDNGIPVVTFDHDVENTTRTAYIGTDQVFLGQTQARLLRQLRPEGGKYAIICRKDGRYEGFIQEISRYNNNKDKASWYEAFEFDRDDQNYTLEYEIGLEYGADVFIFQCQTPMKDENWTYFAADMRARNVTLIGVDGSDWQIDYLNKRSVDGLIGQLPFEIGSKSIQVLYDTAMKRKAQQGIMSTNLVSYNLIPADLPPLNVDDNLIGNLVYIGYTCFVVIAFMVLVCVVWTIQHRKDLVVRAAQPFFLFMVAGGVLILACALIPLTFDDNGEPDSLTSRQAVTICMSVPWLVFTGFTVAFSALFSKTWRINRLFFSKVRMARMQVTEKDVLAPFVVLLTSNMIVLICWTAIDPLTYTRHENEGLDYWNRVISTYGVCKSDSALAFLSPLAVINLGVVAIACWQAYQARAIKSEFAEAKYIALAVFSLFQAFFTGVPVLIVVRNMPEAYYILLTMMIFILCMALLLLIFLPKIFIQKKYAGLSEEEQRKMLHDTIRKHGSSDFGYHPQRRHAQQPSSVRNAQPSDETKETIAGEMGSDRYDEKDKFVHNSPIERRNSI
ncbi:hypothetical protein FisN_2Lh399 [Fistulifera solaris]|uniref:G-protein coupled receptors family 3 profile domain-containing protein n=1 Tax=Fistulifera solaris TaxID=1519565 RepID=A0A1Z5JQ18_FISSO|nr:hypothetical protein FisN_2Lh399 [Fistulifera solaris]|eukprot:GAX15871.1 hypothetical protein FisN_2Lh399 [Fistulifera solaris]